MQISSWVLTTCKLVFCKLVDLAYNSIICKLVSFLNSLQHAKIICKLVFFE